jgi:hypothetical protein
MCETGRLSPRHRQSGQHEIRHAQPSAAHPRHHFAVSCSRPSRRDSQPQVYDLVLEQSPTQLLRLENHVKIHELTKNKFASLFKLIFILLTAPLALQIMYVVLHCVVFKHRNIQRAGHAHLQDLS